MLTDILPAAMTLMNTQRGNVCVALGKSHAPQPHAEMGTTAQPHAEMGLQEPQPGTELETSNNWAIAAYVYIIYDTCPLVS